MPRRTPTEPVAPSRTALIFFYDCPHCHGEVPCQTPMEPDFLTCMFCGEKFPIVPVDFNTVNFFRIMTAEGKALADSEFA